MQTTSSTAEGASVIESWPDGRRSILSTAGVQSAGRKGSAARFGPRFRRYKQHRGARSYAAFRQGTREAPGRLREPVGGQCQAYECRTPATQFRSPPRRKTPIRCSVLFDKTQVLSYNSSMAIRWTDSADKHDVAREDALHAMLNHYLYVAEFDEPRVEEAGRPDLYVGPTAAARGRPDRSHG